MTSACLALGQLLISGVPMAGGVLWASLGLFLVSAIMEGAITVAAVRAIERLNPAWVSGPQPASSRTVAAVGLAALVLLVVGTLIASSAPDGIQRVTGQGVDSLGWRPKDHGRLGGHRDDLRALLPAGKLKSRRRSA